MDHVKGFQVSLDENELPFDLKKEQENAAKGQGLSPEQLKQMQEAQAKAAKETNTVKALNEKLNIAKTAADAGDYDTAITALTEDATRNGSIPISVSRMNELTASLVCRVENTICPVRAA